MAKETKKPAVKAEEKKGAAPEVKSEESANIVEQIRNKNVISDEARIEAIAQMKKDEDEKKKKDYITAFQKIEYINGKVKLSMVKRRKEAKASKEMLDKSLALLLKVGGQIEGAATLADGYVVNDCKKTIEDAGYEATAITPNELDTELTKMFNENRKRFNEIEEEHRKMVSELRNACKGAWYLEYDQSYELDRLYR